MAHGSFKKGCNEMSKTGFAKPIAAGAGLILLWAVSGLACAQSLPPAPAQPPQKISPAVRPKRVASPLDDFAGLKLTDEQKAKINQIHRDFQARADVVVKDEKLNPDQKAAMLEGYQRMERGQAYKVLTPEQQIEVRKKALARRAEAQKEQERKKLAQPK